MALNEAFDELDDGFAPEREALRKAVNASHNSSLVLSTSISITNLRLPYLDVNLKKSFSTGLIFILIHSSH